MDRGDEEALCESNVGEETFESDSIGSSSPPRDDPQSSEDSKESSPFSEPACMSTSGSCPTSEGQYRKLSINLGLTIYFVFL